MKGEKETHSSVSKKGREKEERGSNFEGEKERESLSDGE